jgi:acyl-CoA thioesterase YciA
VVTGGLARRGEREERRSAGADDHQHAATTEHQAPTGGIHDPPPRSAQPETSVTTIDHPPSSFAVLWNNEARMSERVPAIKVLLLPKDTNAYGTIFGGVILSNIDLASAIEARKAAAHRYVTRAMRGVEFHQPVYLGDIVSFYTETVRVGRTSITVRVEVEAERWGAPPATMQAPGHGERVKVTEAEVILVAVNERGDPVPVRPEAPTA